jgi:hypothetical protein
MSLTRKRRSTAKSVAANRANARKSRGPATPPGKAHAGAARLRHGFFSTRADEPMAELGEDPREYGLLLESLVEDLQPREGLEAELVLRIRRVLWRMRRVERMEDGAALKRVHAALRGQDLGLGPKLLQVHENRERLLGLCEALKCADYVPTPEAVDEFAAGFGETPGTDLQNFFKLLRMSGEAGAQPQDPLLEGGALDARQGTGEEERKAARGQVVRALGKLIVQSRMTLDMLLEESERIHSPENIAAIMASEDASKRLTQRMADSNIRDLWRLTRILLTLKRSAKGEDGND